jgi:hypothetical protein
MAGDLLSLMSCISSRSDLVIKPLQNAVTKRRYKTPLQNAVTKRRYKTPLTTKPPLLSAMALFKSLTF